MFRPLFRYSWGPTQSYVSISLRAVNEAGLFLCFIVDVSGVVGDGMYHPCDLVNKSEGAD